MAGLDPAIHAPPAGAYRFTWMPGTRPGMTSNSISAPGELRRTEGILALDVGDRLLARATGQHGKTALHRRPRHDLTIPALYRRIFIEIDISALGKTRRRLGGSADPREGDDVGHAVFVAGQPVHLLE